MSTQKQVECSSCHRSQPNCGFPPGKLTCSDCSATRKKKRSAASQRKTEAKEEKHRGTKQCAHGTRCDKNDFNSGQKYCEKHREYNKNRSARARACSQALALPAELNHIPPDSGSISSTSLITEVVSVDLPVNVTLSAGTLSSFDTIFANETLPELPDIAEIDIDILNGQLIVDDEVPCNDGCADNPVVDMGVNLTDQFGQMHLSEDITKGASSPSEICNNCGSVGSEMKRCGQCRSVWYCNKICQRKSWKLHKKICAPPPTSSQGHDQIDTCAETTQSEDKKAADNSSKTLTHASGNNGAETVHIEDQSVQPEAAANPFGCAWCAAVPALHQCTRCQSVSYCSRSCEKKHLENPQGHKRRCPELHAVHLIRQIIERSVNPPLSGDARCLICLGGVEDGDLKQRGCACRGDLGLVHLDCAVQAARVHAETTKDTSSWLKCATCEQKFTGAVEAACVLKMWSQFEPLEEANESRLKACTHLACSLYNAHALTAVALLRLVVESMDTHLGEPHLETMTAKRMLCMFLVQCGMHGEAEQMLRSIIAMCAQQMDDPQLEDPLSCLALAVKKTLADAIVQQGRHGEAEQIYHHLHSWISKLCGPDNPHTISALSDLAVAINRQERHYEAEEMAHQAWLSFKRVLGVGHPDTCCAFEDYMDTLKCQHKQKECAELRGVRLSELTDTLGPEHRNTLVQASLLGSHISSHGTTNMEDRHTEALTYLRPTFDTMRRVLGLSDEDTLITGRCLLINLSFETNTIHTLRDMYILQAWDIGLILKVAKHLVYIWDGMVLQGNQGEEGVEHILRISKYVCAFSQDIRKELLGDAHEDTENVTKVLTGY